jgi:hypothetical protein
MHENSLLAFDQIEEDRGKRAEAIYRLLIAGGRPMTDREIMTQLGFRERNATAPRITELIDNRWLVETGSIECPVTGKRVRRVRALTDEERQQLIARQRAALAPRRPAVVVQQELSLC